MPEQRSDNPHPEEEIDLHEAEKEGDFDPREKTGRLHKIRAILARKVPAIFTRRNTGGAPARMLNVCGGQLHLKDVLIYLRMLCVSYIPILTRQKYDPSQRT
jgi:hypothetical protein